MSKLLLVVDIDNTLSNTTHREHLVPSKNVSMTKEEKNNKWREFFEYCDKDTANQAIVDVIK